ncbi:hypothetical protein P4O66_020292 [Electrophorus voltai]|uniref:Uncharacterized protein n=1 Tax=Electrophorus voltai TaxID=2609070 RepID=A0AAD9E404_9TELE|nr:hypothetical protein P4O66_020292 [Electrophorus voltai]
MIPWADQAGAVLFSSAAAGENFACPVGDLASLTRTISELFKWSAGPVRRSNPHQAKGQRHEGSEFSQDARSDTHNKGPCVLPSDRSVSACSVEVSTEMDTNCRDCTLLVSAVPRAIRGPACQRLIDKGLSVFWSSCS